MSVVIMRSLKRGRYEKHLSQGKTHSVWGKLVESKIMETGTVKWFNADKGFGFIAPDKDGDDLFVHFSEVKGPGLNEGDQVEYEIGQGRKGPCATNVTTI